jgi:membrane-associated phospholipid phosphatase
MPSFHTICGLLIVYACRGHRYLWLAAVAYATVMIASTPIMGGHYFVDLIAGALLTAAVVAIDKRTMQAVERHGELPAAAVPDGARS